MTGRKFRQRGHSDYGYAMMLWIITAAPYFAGVVVALIAFVVWWGWFI